MKKNVLTLVVSVLILVLLIAGGTIVYNKNKDSAGGSFVKVEKPQDGGDDVAESGESISENSVPDVEIYNADGEKVMLSRFFGKPVVLNFWATWCGPCKSEMPGFNRLYEKYKDKVNFVMLNVSEDKKTVERFLKDNGYSFPVYYDKTQVASYTYGASSIPLTFVLDKGGELFGYQMGVLSEEALEDAIKTVLGDE